MVSFPTRIWVSLQAGNTFRRLSGWSALWLMPWRKLQEKLQFESQNSNNLWCSRGETGWSFPTRKPGASCLLPQVSRWSLSHISIFSSLFLLTQWFFLKKRQPYSISIHLCKHIPIISPISAQMLVHSVTFLSWKMALSAIKHPYKHGYTVDNSRMLLTICEGDGIQETSLKLSAFTKAWWHHTWHSLGEPIGGRSAGFLSPGSWCQTSSCPEPESGWPRRACSRAQLGQKQCFDVIALISPLISWIDDQLDHGDNAVIYKYLIKDSWKHLFYLFEVAWGYVINKMAYFCFFRAAQLPPVIFKS